MACHSKRGLWLGSYCLQVLLNYSMDPTLNLVEIPGQFHVAVKLKLLTSTSKHLIYCLLTIHFMKVEETLESDHSNNRCNLLQMCLTISAHK